MRKILFTLLSAILFQSLFCQQDSLLQKFKFRIDHYRVINLNINGGGGYNKSALGSGIHKNSSASAGAGALYYTVKSTDRILLTTSGSLYSSYYGSKEKNPTENTSSKALTIAPVFSVLNKWFLKNMFTELGADISTDVNFRKDVAVISPNSFKNNQGHYSVAIQTGIGKGRLENITDMQNALWLYKELEEAQIMSRQLSGDELTQLGQTITKGNNTRVLDARRRTQFILRTVDNYFQQKSLITKTDIDYFVRLNDILFLALNDPRLAGTEKYIRVRPALSRGNDDLTRYDNPDKYEQRSNTLSVALTSGINKYMPVNLVHQQNYGGFIKLAYISKEIKDRQLNAGTIVTDTRITATLRQASLNLFFQHAIYPNTRTIISFNLQSEGGYQRLEHESNFYADANLSGVLNYFISYRTRLNCNLGISYQNNVYYNEIVYFYERPDNIQLNASLGLQVSL